MTIEPANAERLDRAFPRGAWERVHYRKLVNPRGGCYRGPENLLTEMTMLRFCPVLLMVFGVASSVVAAEPSKTLKVGSNPESVCRGFGGKLYVTMISGEEPGDGTIVAVDGEEVSVFAKGFNAPKGIVFVGKHLITADETTVWKINAEGEATKLVTATDFPAPIEFLNDVAVAKDGESVYVTEMSKPTPMFDPSGDRKLFALDSPEAKTLPNKGCVYKVTLEGKVSLAVPPGNPLIRFPNGVASGGTKEKERLFVGDFFTGDIVRYVDEKYQAVGKGPRGIDGITVTKDAFIASSWVEGKVVKIDRKSGESKVLIEGLKSAADFFYDGKNQQLIIPDMIAGTLIFLPLE